MNEARRRRNSGTGREGTQDATRGTRLFRREPGRESVRRGGHWSSEARARSVTPDVTAWVVVDGLRPVRHTGTYSALYRQGPETSRVRYRSSSPRDTTWRGGNSTPAEAPVGAGITCLDASFKLLGPYTALRPATSSAPSPWRDERAGRNQHDPRHRRRVGSRRLSRWPRTSGPATRRNGA